MCDKLKAFTNKPLAGHSACNGACLLFLAPRLNATGLITWFTKKSVEDVASDGGKVLAFNRRSIILIMGLLSYIRNMASKRHEDHETLRRVFNVVSIAIASHIFACSL